MSSSNIVSPNPRTSSSAIGAACLPSYTAPICDKSTISKSDLIQALAGKTNTKEGKFNCAKDKLAMVLIPIVENQHEFYSAFERIDRANSTLDVSLASSLKAAFIIDFPVVDEDAVPIKFRLKKSSLTKNFVKEDLAHIIANLYKLIELAKPSKFFRKSMKLTAELVALVDRAIDYISELKVVESQPKLLRGEKRAPHQLTRKYLNGGVFLPDQACFRICVFCKHSFVDEDPNNKNVLENNRKKEDIHNKLRAELEDFKNGRRSTPPVGANGKPVTKRLPPLNREAIILQCHCHQMRCARANTDTGSTCELKCCNPITGERYEWAIENGISICNCPVCRCQCKKAYKLDNMQHIMAEIAKEDAFKDKNGKKNGEVEQEKRSLEIQEFISNSIQYGYERRSEYKAVLDEMKNKGE